MKVSNEFYNAYMTPLVYSSSNGPDVPLMQSQFKPSPQELVPPWTVAMPTEVAKRDPAVANIWMGWGWFERC